VARRLGSPHWKKKDAAAQAHVAGSSLVLVKPQSYMNESGWPLSRIAGWWKTPARDMLVVVDDLDLPFGRLRMRESGGSGGHNGLKSIIENFGDGFPRLRIGIGRGADDAIDHVLSVFSREEEAALTAILSAAADGIERWLAAGPVEAMNTLNVWRLPDGELAERREP